jgi:hypothetical protein
MAIVGDQAIEVGPIESFMTEDHVQLDRLLRASQRPDGTIDDTTYRRFRGGLLRHIAMEEKVLLPFARSKAPPSTHGDLTKDTPLAIAPQLRADHSEIAILLVRSPTTAIIAELETILGRHNELEEGPRGLYATCDALAGDEAEQLVERLRAQPEIPQAKYFDGPLHRRGT